MSEIAQEPQPHGLQGYEQGYEAQRRGSLEHGPARAGWLLLGIGFSLCVWAAVIAVLWMYFD